MAGAKRRSVGPACYIVDVYYPQPGRKQGTTMPRDLPLSNGKLLVNFDSTYTLRDIYYPYVGLENQTDGHECRLGVWADGRFAWLSESGWSRQLLYEPDTLATA